MKPVRLVSLILGALALVGMLVMVAGKPVVASSHRGPVHLRPNASPQQVERWIGWMRADGMTEDEIGHAVTAYLDHQVMLNGYGSIPVVRGDNSLKTLWEGHTQKDADLYIGEEVFSSIMGQMKPGSMDIAAGETELIFVTSHLGYNDGNANWAEVGVQRSTGYINGGKPWEYDVFTYLGGSMTYSDGTSGVKQIKAISATEATAYYPYVINITTSMINGKYIGYMGWGGKIVANIRSYRRTCNPDVKMETFTVTGGYSTPTSTPSIYGQMFLRRSDLIQCKSWGTSYGAETGYSKFYCPPAYESFHTGNYRYTVEFWLKREYVGGGGSCY
ncbi:MAG: hypothetical protein HYX75_13555 [Acidobacteria bacterium]|nr:hypothetical protein [Acidobacteriota bacterium]